MNDISEQLPADPILAKYMAMTAEEHRDEIATLRGDISNRLLHLGKAVYGWKMKGFDLDDLGMNGMTEWLLRVGCDQLYAPLLARTMRDKKLTRRLSHLPLADQKHIGDGGKLNLLVITPDGPTTIEADPVVMRDNEHREQFNQLLGPNYVRSVTEQRLWIEARKSRAARPTPESIGLMRPDRERGGVVSLGPRGSFIPLADLEAAVRALKKKRTN